MGDQFPVVEVGQQTFYTIDRQYSRVCRRIIGYQVGNPDGFNQYHGMIILNQGYMDGVSITYRYLRHHIWSYVTGAYETRPTLSNCPYSPVQGAEPQEFIGSNYYCESGYPSNRFIPLEVFTSDPLWDGERCEGTCCSDTKSFPPFSVQLPTNTTDRIEVHICADEPTINEDILRH